MVPLMINSYNAGDRRMEEAVVWFADNFGTREDFENTMGHYPDSVGYDAFFVLTQTVRTVDTGVLRGYGDDASKYVPKICAFTRLLSDRGF